MTHTPGPWTLRKDEGGPIRKPYWIAGENSGHVADVWWDQDVMEDGEPLANGRLIAAAPELLQACAFALETIERHLPELSDGSMALLLRGAIESALDKTEEQ